METPVESPEMLTAPLEATANEASDEEDEPIPVSMSTIAPDADDVEDEDDVASSVQHYHTTPMGANNFQTNVGYRPTKRQSDNYAGYGYKTDFDIDITMIDEAVIRAFQQIDTNNSGRLSRSEMFAAFCNPNGSDFAKETIVLLCGMFDSDRSGGLDLRDFAHLYYFMEEWLTLWKIYDADNKGYMINTEMVHALKELGYSKIDPTIVQQLCIKLSKAGRKLYMDPFIRICSVCKRITDNFRQKDRKRRGRLRMNYNDFVKMALRSCF